MHVAWSPTAPVMSVTHDTFPVVVIAPQSHVVVQDRALSVLPRVGGLGRGEQRERLQSLYRRLEWRRFCSSGLAVAAPILFASGASACGWGCDCAPSYGYSYGYSAPRVYGYSSYGYGSYYRPAYGYGSYYGGAGMVRIRRLLPSRRALLWSADVRLAWRSGRP